MAQRRRRSSAPAHARPTDRGPVGLALVVGTVVALTAGVVSVTWASAAPQGEPAALPTITVTPSLPTVTVTPTPKATPSPTSTKPAKRLTLAELHVKVAEVDADLDRRTAELKTAKKALDESRERLVVVRAAAADARKQAEQAHVDLGKYAAAAYRGQQISPVVTVLMGPPAGAVDTLRNLQNLEQAGEIKTDITTYAAQTAERAESLEREAATLETSNAAAAAALETKRDEAAKLVRTTQKQLAAEVKRLAVIEARKLARNCTKKAQLAAQFPNGMIPQELLCSVGVGAFVMRGDAAVAFKELAAAYKKDLDAEVCVTSAYRTRDHQASLYANDPVMVAPPGRSHHGLGLALDLCGGIERFGTEQHKWMKKHAGKFGFFHPDWAEPDGVTPEPWHWEFQVDAYPDNEGAHGGQDAEAKPTKSRN